MKNSTTQQRRPSTNGAPREQDPMTRNEALNPVGDVRDYALRYFREQPEVSALACLGIGFILGWKLKPW